MSAPAIEVRGLCHTYLVGTPLEQVSLRGVDLRVERGRVVALIGATGSGKSTLLQHLNGLLRPQRGWVTVLGKDLADPTVDLRAVRRRVGLLFQRPEQQLFEEYVGDDVAYGPRLAGLTGAALRERVRWAMERAGLGFEEFKDRRVRSLSGGERRKAGLAGVLALRPEVLLLDEPTAGLDPVSRGELHELLRRLREEGVTLVLATHNMDDVAELAEWVYVLHEGQVALGGTPRQVFAQAGRLIALGLDVPACTALMAALRAQGLRVAADALTVDEAEEEVLALIEGKDAVRVAPGGEG